MNCFRKLGIKQSASIPEIKRAYAAKLKLHRPDDDPAGFQEVNTAYQSAIENAKQRDAWLLRKAETEQRKQLAIAEGTYLAEDEDDEYYDDDEYYFDDEEDIEETPEPVIHEPASLHQNETAPVSNAEDAVIEPEPEIESQAEELSRTNDTAPDQDDDIFHLDQFIEELESISRQDDDNLLKRWLDNHPDLYSLYLKHQITEPLISALARTENPIRPPALEIVIAFFGLDAVSANHYWIDHQVEMSRQTSKTFWLAAAIAHERKSRERSPHERWIDESLLGTSNNFKTLYLLVFPGLPTKAMEIANEVRDEHGNYATDFVEHESFQFWINVNDKTRISSQRLFMASIRAAIYSFGMVAWLNFTNMVQSFALGFGVSFSILFGGWLLIALLRIGNYRLDLYVIRKQTVDKGNILLAIISPIVVITSLLTDHEAVSIPAWVMTFLCFSLVTSGKDKESRPAAYFAFFSGAAFFISMLSFSTIPEILSENKFILSANLSIGLIAIHDEIYTRKHRCTYEETREHSAWLVWIASILIVLLLVTIWIHFP